MPPESRPDRLAHRIYHSLPRNFSGMDLKRAVEAGMLPKASLLDGQDYIGHSRNAVIARWNAETQRFLYLRTKFERSFEETIVHPEDDQGFDVFVPVAPLTKKVADSV